MTMSLKVTGPPHNKKAEVDRKRSFTLSLKTIKHSTERDAICLGKELSSYL
jgi:hypothetical protein